MLLSYFLEYNFFINEKLRFDLWSWSNMVVQSDHKDKWLFFNLFQRYNDFILILFSSTYLMAVCVITNILSWRRDQQSILNWLKMYCWICTDLKINWSCIFTTCLLRHSDETLIEDANGLPNCPSEKDNGWLHHQIQLQWLGKWTSSVNECLFGVKSTSMHWAVTLKTFSCAFPVFATNLVVVIS